MAKATTTIQQRLNHKPEHGAWFAANQALFNQIAAFYFSVIKEKALAKGKKFTERPPVPPRSWKKSATIYAGQWKERSASSIMLKVWTGSCWSWVRCRLTGRELPDDAELGSPQLVRHGKEWWLHTPVERKFSSPAKVEEQITTNAHTKICAVDLNMDGPIAVCTVQTAEGSTLATRFISGGPAVSGF